MMEDDYVSYLYNENCLMNKTCVTAPNHVEQSTLIVIGTSLLVLPRITIQLKEYVGFIVVTTPPLKWAEYTA